jgi:signal transduction histidine kinase
MSGEDRPPADQVEHARLQKALRESLILRELADILNSSFDLEHILQELVKRTTELCEVTRCAVWLLEETWNRFRPVTYYVASPSLREEMLKTADAIWYHSPLPPDNPVIQQLLSAGGMLYLEDLRTEPTVATFAETFQVHSVLLIALIREGRPVGMMSLDEPGQPYTFSQDQQQLARAIAQQATIAIDNARLYQQAQAQKRRAEQLIERARAIYQVAMTVNSGEELPAVLRLATSHLVRGLGAEDGRAMLLEPGETTLRPIHPADYQASVDSSSLTFSLERLPHFRHAIATGKPILITSNQAKAEEIEWFRLFNLKNILLVPLLGSTPEQEANWDLPGESKDISEEGGTLPAVYCPGLIAIHYTRRREPTRGEYAFAQDIAAQCALAIEKARLLADTRRIADVAIERANMLDEFLAVTAHEFRNPLTVILARSQSALRALRRANRAEHAETSYAQVEEHLELIAAQSKQLNNIVTTFLDAARLNQGQFTLKTEIVDLGQIARQVVANQASLADHHTLRCQLNEVQAPYLVHGDQARLAQIIANLVENAIKYSPLGGPVTVMLNKRQKGDQAETIEVRVSDKGVGIPPEAQARLFERFYRVPNVASGEIRGVGLGLYIVAHLVRLHGGEIRVESSGLPGEGSCFIFTLPALALSAENKQPGAGAAHHTDQIT